MRKLLVVVVVIIGLVFMNPFLVLANFITNQKPDNFNNNIQIEVAEGRLFIGMTKVEAYEAKGTPYRVKRLEGEEGKEMWIYRCYNNDGFNEDCLYLYFNGDELDKIERP